MSIIKIIFISTLCLFLLNCADEIDNSIKSENSYSRNIDTLKNYINAEKYKPVNVMWKATILGDNNPGRITTPGPTDYKLEAFIQFDRLTADKLKDENKIGVEAYNVISIDKYWFNWLPKDMKFKDKFDSSQIYNADPFVKSPLSQGNYVFLNVNTILITLQTQ